MGDSGASRRDRPEQPAYAVGMVGAVEPFFALPQCAGLGVCDAMTEWSARWVLESLAAGVPAPCIWCGAAATVGAVVVR